jgi:hypothetical protein
MLALLEISLCHLLLLLVDERPDSTLLQKNLVSSLKLLGVCVHC